MLNNQINSYMIVASTRNYDISILFCWKNKVIESRLHKFWILHKPQSLDFNKKSGRLVQVIWYLSEESYDAIPNETVREGGDYICMKKFTCWKNLILYEVHKDLLTWSSTMFISLFFSTVSRLILLARRTSASAFTCYCKDQWNNIISNKTGVAEWEQSLVPR